ncbi:hypothetical protein [Sphingobacterium arenae]|uniref:3-oxoacyl-ACP synthase n=1 Tax=Sphingobacterium arenae TaxID=1280598 RepID=A0ABR7Y5P2_9SPHI|nr:hypothetical protein [Sphingobacterium arenae]MBD1426632.1 hypothetical protein [Sphingobacterium arenae]
MDIGVKKELLRRCFKKIEERLGEISIAIQQAQEATENETKSSAGDKYETSREMLQQDLNRFHIQLSQARKDHILLQKIEVGIKKNVEIGAIVTTDYLTYFIAVSLGQQEIGGKKIVVISPASPIGKLLVGAATGEYISLNGTKQLITGVY